MIENGRKLAYDILDILDDTKGEDILILDLIEVCSFTDYFVICTGTTERMLDSLAEVLQTKMKKLHGQGVMKIEGDAQSGWILMDYGDVIVHLFSQDLRNYYRLEELWREGKIMVRIQ
ncbi:MAG: ribosome silencing factor [Anaerolineales bacterium]|jgi:ribosome-associated protein